MGFTRTFVAHYAFLWSVSAPPPARGFRKKGEATNRTHDHGGLEGAQSKTAGAGRGHDQNVKNPLCPATKPNARKEQSGESKVCWERRGGCRLRARGKLVVVYRRGGDIPRVLRTYQPLFFLVLTRFPLFL